MSQSVQSVNPVQVVAHDAHDVGAQELLGRVHGQLQSVEAGVGLREGVYLAERHRLDQEFGVVASIALQFSTSAKRLLEPINGDAGAPGAEVQQLAQLLLVHFLNQLPEPLDDLVVLVVGSLVLSVAAPVLHTDKGDPVQDHLEFVRVEN